MAAPVTYPSVKRFFGIAKEVTPGTPVAMTSTILMDKLDWTDKPTWLKDKALRGVMGDDSFNIIQGVKIGELDMGGPVFGDSIGWPLANALGDLTVTGATAPYTNAFSLLNSGSGQPVTHTITQYYGITPTSGSRQFSSTAFSEVGFKFNAESELLSWTGKATSWASNAAVALPTAAPSTVIPIAGWRAIAGVGGPASGGTQVLTVESFEATIKRQVKPFFTAQNSQNPYIVQRGGVTFDGKMTFIAADETPFTNMINNSQPQIQVVISNGASGASLVTLQFDMQVCAFTEAKANFGKEAVEWDVTFEGVFNTTNAGTSGGMSPVKVTLTNAVTSGTYQ